MNLISVPAVTAAARELMPPGALPDPAEARALVHDLREAAETSTDLVPVSYTHLTLPTKA